MYAFVSAPSAKEKLLDASLSLIRERGFAATTVDELCTRAGVTKGAFFHHFASKEDLAVAAALAAAREEVNLQMTRAAAETAKR